MWKKIYTFLKAYEFAELLFYSLSIFFDFSSHSINENIEESFHYTYFLREYQQKHELNINYDCLVVSSVNVLEMQGLGLLLIGLNLWKNLNVINQQSISSDPCFFLMKCKWWYAHIIKLWSLSYVCLYL